MKQFALAVSLAVCASAAADPCSAKGCRALDVAVAVDGSGSMARSFGRHPHGFYALMEMVRGWAEQLPLSGAKAGSASGAHADGVRVGLVQFSTSSVVTPVGVGSGGRLTGNPAEVAADAAWHGDAYVRGRSNLEGALELVGRMFEREAGSTRQRVLVVFAAGKLSDGDRLGAARAHLVGLGVRIFAVVLRRHRAHTQADRETQATLRPLTSGPHGDHFENLQLSEVPGLLATICDPASRWGGVISACGGEPKACAGHASEAACEADAGCGWNAKNAACEGRGSGGDVKPGQAVDECSAQCSTCAKGTCSNAGQACRDPDTSATSLGDWVCACLPPATGSAVANAASCSGSRPTPPAGPCSGHSSEAACVVNAGCSWNAQAAVCEGQGASVKPGQAAPAGLCGGYSSKVACEADAGCGWNTQTTVCEGRGSGGDVKPGQAVDECSAQCPTCAKGTCSNAGQACRDPDTSATSLGDWVCACLPPATGSAVANAASC